MKAVLVKDLKPFLDAISSERELYVPCKNGEHYVFVKYDPAGGEPQFNNIRACMPVKEFLFPMRELAAVFPETSPMTNIKPFAVFGLKDCDLRSIEILDRVFAEEDFLDPFYEAHRSNMFVISSDCFEPADSCCCNIFDGQSFPKTGFDLNLSKTETGFIIEAGSKKGQDFLKKHEDLFTDVPEQALAERNAARRNAQQQLEQINADQKPDAPIKQIMENSEDSQIFDVEAENCIECQACTRVCPTCHCFYLYDTKREDYFGKMKMWDSCMRLDYATVAGGANPRKILGDRLKHRLMHKFVYFLDRYGINMCVGCGRCVDADAGGLDIRQVLKKLNEELKNKPQTKAAK